jgi:hypothetical protein
MLFSNYYYIWQTHSAMCMCEGEREREKEREGERVGFYGAV